MDLVAIARAHGQACMQVFLVRGGKLIGQEHFILDGVHDQSDDDADGGVPQAVLHRANGRRAGRCCGFRRAESLATIRRRFRRQAGAANDAPTSAAAVPKEILVDGAARRTRDDRVVAVEHQGPARAHSAAAARRARRVPAPRAEERRAEPQSISWRIRKCRRPRRRASLTDLADALELPEPPHRIECYDVSNIQGTNPVASMVVFVEGRAKKSEYRKFKIQYDRGPNDFAMMQETLRRRLRYLRRETDKVDTPMERELAKKEKLQQEARSAADRRRKRAARRRGRGAGRARYDGPSSSRFG